MTPTPAPGWPPKEIDDEAARSSTRSSSARPTPAAREVFHSFSKGMCPTCRELVDGARIIRDGKVYLRKQCPRARRSRRR